MKRIIKDIFHKTHTTQKTLYPGESKLLTHFRGCFLLKITIRYTVFNTFPHTLIM